MIRDDKIDRALLEACPQTVCVFPLPDGWSAFELGLAGGNILRAEIEVVRAGFDSKRPAVAAAFGDERQGIGRGEVHDMGRDPKLVAQLHHQPDSLILPRPGPRAQIGPVAVCSAADAHLRPDFGMHQKRYIRAHKRIHHMGQVVPGDRGELINPRVDEEHLEAEHAGLDERINIGAVSRNDAAIKSAVDMQLRPGGLYFSVQRVNGRGDRIAVERHIGKHGYPACRSRPGGAGEALPIRSARLVDMHMRVDQSRHQQSLARVIYFNCRQVRSFRQHLLDAAIPDHYGSGHDAVGKRHAAALYDQVGEGCHGVTAAPVVAWRA